jgi:hypothetical protein
MRKYVLPNDKKNFEAIIKQYIDKHNLDPKHGYTEEEALFKVGTFHLKKLMNALGKLSYNKKYYEELGF